MEILAPREDLLKAVSRVQNIIEKKSNMPILSTVLLTAENGELSISATDLEVGLEQIISSKVIKSGSLTISGRKLYEILRESASDDVIMKENDNNWVFISDGNARYNLASLPADEFPGIAEPDNLNGIEIIGNHISEMIDKTIHSVTAEDAGYKLSGIFTEIIQGNQGKLLRMVATDGHRLSMVDKPFDNLDDLELHSGIMIPKKAMIEISKLGSESDKLFFAVKDKYCVIKREGLLLNVRLLESKFPDYRAVIPNETPVILHLQRNFLLEAMRRMLILSNERYRAVKVGLEEGRMDLVSTNPDLGNAQESISIDYRGEKIEVGFNPRYFVDALQVMESDNITLGFKDESKPCILKGEIDHGFLALMMPMRL